MLVIGYVRMLGDCGTNQESRPPQTQFSRSPCQKRGLEIGGDQFWTFELFCLLMLLTRCGGFRASSGGRRLAFLHVQRFVLARNFSYTTSCPIFPVDNWVFSQTAENIRFFAPVTSQSSCTGVGFPNDLRVSGRPGRVRDFCQFGGPKKGGFRMSTL